MQRVGAGGSEVVIDEEVRRRAEGSIRRMLQIGRSK